MQKAKSVIGLFLALGLMGLAWAGDIVDMPTGNLVAPHNFEVNYIYWDVDFGPKPAPQYIHIFEGFVGVTDWLELDAIVADVHNDDTYVKLNAYVRVLPESPSQPSLIVGATNLTASDWPGNDNISPFVLTAYNLNTPKAAPSLQDPLVRLQLGYGWEAHEEKFFGGLQFMCTPQFGGAIFNYQGAPAYIAVYRPVKEWELRIGFKDSDPFYSLGYFGKW